MRSTRIALCLALALTALMPPNAPALAARNGPFILFSAYGANTPYHVFKIRVDGTDLTRLSGPRGGHEPAWSSDGRRIAYVGRSGIVVMRSNGTHRRLLNEDGSAPQWSPDDRHILFTRFCCDVEFTEHSWVVVTRPDGSHERRVAYARAPRSVGGATWAPGGRTLAYVKSHLSNAIFLVDRRGDERRRLIRRDSIQSYDWAPDGTRIVFSCRCSRDQEDLYVVHVGSGRVTRITRTPGFEWDPDWSPDGDRIVAVRWHADFSGRAKLITVDPDGEQVATLASRLRGHPSPSWSPNGDRIVFMRRGWSEIFVMDEDGSNEIQVTHDHRDQVDVIWQPR